MNELQVDFKMEELGSEGSFYAEYDTMRFPEVPPEPNEGTEATLVPVSPGGGGGYSDLVPTGVCRWSRQTNTYL